jgi:glycosyltransferase involved in cell wall biosynthesis
MFLFLESFYGGSHQVFADGLVKHSEHPIELHTLPAERWRQRRRTAGLAFARRIANPQQYRGVLVTDLIDIRDLRAVWKERCPPLLLYMHESQMTYPSPKGETRDIDSALLDIKNALFADRIAFNSHFHRDRFLSEAEPVLEELPHVDSAASVEHLREHSTVLYPGVELPEKPPAGAAQTAAGAAVAGARAAAGAQQRSPVILWNHRWEYDKRPGLFFRALSELAGRGAAFRLIVLGENPQRRPKPFLRAKEELGERMLVFGFEPDRERYLAHLREADIVVSTAIQENFGIAVVEAMASGCLPLLPERLSYPELLPEGWHDLCLYSPDARFRDRLQAMLDSPLPDTTPLVSHMHRFSWTEMARHYDAALEELARLGHPRRETAKRAYR